MKFTRKVDFNSETSEILVGYIVEGPESAGVIGATRAEIIVHGNFHITRIEDMQAFQQALIRCVVHKLYLSANPPIVGVEPKTLTDAEADAKIAEKRNPGLTA